MTNCMRTPNPVILRMISQWQLRIIGAIVSLAATRDIDRDDVLPILLTPAATSCHEEITTDISVRGIQYRT